MKSVTKQTSVRDYLFRIITLLALVLALTVPKVQAGQLQDCSAYGDSNSICAPISQLAMQLSDGTLVATGGGVATLPTTANSLKFVFTSNSANSDKEVFVQFFDISPGLTLVLPAEKCSSSQLQHSGCVAKLNTNGSVTIPISVSGITAGKVFKYQINGPAGFTSGFVVTTYTSSGTVGATPEACVGDTTTVCAPITRISLTSAGSALPVNYDSVTGDGSSYIDQSTKSINYKFTFPSDYVNKFVFVQFFDITGLDLTVPGGSINSTTSCDPQPAASNGCKIMIDQAGLATFSINLTNNSAAANFKFKIAGPNYDSKVVLVTVGVRPTTSPSPTPSAGRVSAALVAGRGNFTVSINNSPGRVAVVVYKFNARTKTANLRIYKSRQQFVIVTPRGRCQVKVSIGIYHLSKVLFIK
ncbi:MAG: hypothetical protein EBS36_00040 [Actinobacteria bacterium]|nr:hypothetical protein [Actinomycetota bacterium]